MLPGNCYSGENVSFVWSHKAIAFICEFSLTKTEIPFMDSLSFLFFASYCVVLVFVFPHGAMPELRGRLFDSP